MSGYYGRGGSITTAHIGELTDQLINVKQAEEIVIHLADKDVDLSNL